MKNFKIFALILVLVLTFSCLTACTRELSGMADNEILTFTDNSEGKPIIRIGMQYFAVKNNLVEDLQRKFPEYLFVTDYSLSTGAYSENHLYEWLDKGASCDLLIASSISTLASIDEYFLDLSGYSFISNSYVNSSLEKNSADGKLYGLPGGSTFDGIAYNVDMFTQYGWSVPTNLTEFYALCEQISAEGITPFSECCKYSSAIQKLFTTICYNDLFSSPADLDKFNKLMSNQLKPSEVLTPLFAVAEQFADKEIIKEEYFTASLTTQRKVDFYGGNTAMIRYDSKIFELAVNEGCTFEIGFMPYPAQDSADSGYGTASEYHIYIPKSVEKNKKQFKRVIEILEYICTVECQTAMIGEGLMISNVKNVPLPSGEVMKYVRSTYEKGNLYPTVAYEPIVDIGMYELQQLAVKKLCQGETLDNVMAWLDEEYEEGFANPKPPKTYEKVATITEDFTMLETTYYIADQLKEATNAEIALMVNGGFFKSNLARLYAGDITANMEMFVMKDIDVTKQFLTTYKMTGAQIKAFLEGPIISGSEVDVFVAASGLNVKYAPWNERGERLLEVTLSNGSPLVDSQIYIVAAFDSVLAEQYVTEKVASFEDAGSVSDIMLKALKDDAAAGVTIKPDIADRVTLVWKKK